MNLPGPRELLARLRGALSGLLGRSLLAFLLVGLLPLSWTAYSLLRLNREALLSQVLRTHALAARAAAERVAAHVGARAALLQGLAGHPGLDRPREEAARTLLGESLAAWAELGVVGLVVRDPGGAEVVRVQLAGGGDLVDRALEAAGAATPAAAAPAAAVPAITLWIADPAGANPLIWLEVPALGAAARLGMVVRGVEVAAFLAPEEVGDEAELLLLARDGGQLLPVGGESAQRAAGDASVPAGDVGDGEAGEAGVAAAAAVPDPGATPPLARDEAWRQRVPVELALAALSGRVGGAGRFGAGRAATVGAYAPVDGAPWVVLSLQPSAVAEAAAATMTRQSRWAVGGALALIAGLGAVTWRSLVRPLRGVVDAQRRLVGASPLATRAVFPRGRGFDKSSAEGGATPPARNELSELARNLAVLERSLRDRVAIDEVFVGRYRVLDILGAGAMGTVFRGWDPKLERPVALKTLRLAGRPGGGLAQSELRAHLLREAVTVARFSHPNIVGIYDLLDTADAAFLAMEFVDGPSLDVLVWQRRRLAAGAVARLGEAIARALAAAHERGIIHRDIKPSNILLGRDGSIKVSDFGIAELSAAAVAEEGGRIFGTPGFLAPEVLYGAPASARTDLFALGATLYFCLLGKGPFQAHDTRQVVRRTLRGDVLPLLRRRPELPAGLDELVRALLRSQAEERPASAAEVAVSFSRLADQLGTTWEPPTFDPLGRDLGSRDPLAGTSGMPLSHRTRDSGVPTWLGPAGDHGTLPLTSEVELLAGGAESAPRETATDESRQP